MGREPAGVAAQDRRVRILHVAASYLPAVRYGGTIVSVHGLCRALAARGHDVHVFTTSVDGPRDSDVPLERAVDIDGVQVWYFRSPIARRLYWSPAMRRALAQRVPAFDVVHLHALFVWPVWAAAAAARRAATPYVVSPRGMLEKALFQKKSRIVKSVLMAAVVRRLLEGASAIHVTSAREAAEASAFGLALPPLYEVPNGVDAAVSSSALSPAIAALISSTPFLLFVGRISWKKGLDRLIDALAYVPGIPLVIAGNDEEGLLPELKALAAARGVSGRCVFCGPVNDVEKAALFSRALVVVVPSYSENFGNVALEAMAAGCPVAVTPEVGAAGIVRDSAAGLVVDGRPEVLGAALAGLCADEPRRQAMGERGRLAALTHTWASSAQAIERVYHELVE